MEWLSTSARGGLGGVDGQRVTPSQRREVTEAPRNKIGQLLLAEDWWGPGRRKITWQQVLEGHPSVVVNTGATVAGRIVDDRLTAQLSAMLMYSLRDAVMRTCSGWQAAGRSVTIFADELSLVAGASPEGVTWLRNQGRSYGVRAVFATQYPEQVPSEVRTAFFSFGRTVGFVPANAHIATAAAADLSLGGEEWTPAEVASMEKHVAALRATVDQQRQPPVPVKITFWEADIAGFAAAQGWETR